MKTPGPILKQIKDRFDTFPQIDSYADRSRIDGITIKNKPGYRRNGYSITIFAGDSLESLDIAVTAPEGIFGAAAPTRVETSRGLGGMLLIGNQVRKDDLTVMGQMEEPPALEALVLPGDDGFELFEDLQQQLAALKRPIAEAVATTGVAIDPIGVYMKGRWGVRISSDDGTTKHFRNTNYTVCGPDGDLFRAELDGTVTTPNNIEPDSLPVFREGRYYATDIASSNPFSMESLVAFSGLQLQIQNLYA